MFVSVSGCACKCLYQCLGVLQVFVSVSVCACKCLYQCLGVHASVCISVWVYMQVFVSVFGCICKCLYQCLGVYASVISVCACMQVFVLCVHLCMHVNLHACKYLYVLPVCIPIIHSSHGLGPEPNKDLVRTCKDQ